MKFLIVAFLISIAQAQQGSWEIEKRTHSFYEAMEMSSTSQSEVWAWDVIRARMILNFGFEVPLITKFTINPEIEFFFTKK